MHAVHVDCNTFENNYNDPDAMISNYLKNMLSFSRIFFYSAHLDFNLFKATHICGAPYRSALCNTCQLQSILDGRDTLKKGAGQPIVGWKWEGGRRGVDRGGLGGPKTFFTRKNWKKL